MYQGSLVRLRRVEPERDTADRYRWLNDPEVVQYLAMRPARVSREEVRQYLDSCARGTDPAEFAIEALDGTHIGGCTLRGFNHVARSAEFGICIGEKGYRGHGYGTDVSRLMAKIGFEEFNLNRIWLTVYEPNAGGVRAYEKAGFAVEGRLRQYAYLHGQYLDSFLMAILREDYENGKGRA
ncbi:MAG TPA: GNAT family protein [Symbiobacteriaceae bacterium]|nr:GNAT family protein [Symbiobacteriaceae bacterium]